MSDVLIAIAAKRHKRAIGGESVSLLAGSNPTEGILAPLAQLVSAPVLSTVGWRFESSGEYWSYRLAVKPSGCGPDIEGSNPSSSPSRYNVMVAYLLAMEDVRVRSPLPALLRNEHDGSVMSKPIAVSWYARCGEAKPDGLMTVRIRQYQYNSGSRGGCNSIMNIGP